MSARLIKSGQEVLTETFIPFALPDSERHGSSMLTFDQSSWPGPLSIEQAGSEAELIIAEARSKAAEIERQASEDAVRVMQAQIASEVSRLVDPLRDQLGNTLEEIAGLRETIFNRAERELVRLAIEIAKKVVHREVTIDNEIVMTLARIGLSRLQNRIAATIHLHPDDFAYISAHKERLEAGHALELVEDRSIGRGGCLVHTEVGDVDTRIEQQFAEIERAFLEL